MKIYTKTGDKGTTSLIGGKRVPKDDERIEAYGTVDELMAFVALIRDQKIDQHSENMLLKILDRLMVCASLLAADCDDCTDQLPKLHEEDITGLENEIDRMEEMLDPLRSFILPGGHTTVSYCHIARNVCRRAERTAIRLAGHTSVPDNVIKYLNRLSDYLFVLSRKLSKDLEVTEIRWKPEL
jgi:cob(I)alamin adenosyltransferase